MKISSLRSGDDWQLEHFYLQEAGEDMPRVLEGGCIQRRGPFG